MCLLKIELLYATHFLRSFNYVGGERSLMHICVSADSHFLCSRKYLTVNKESDSIAVYLTYT